MEGTYRLPEAQIDRFLFKTLVDYPTESELGDILDLTTGAEMPTPQKTLSAEEILELQELVRQVPIATHVRQAVARLALATQPDFPTASNDVKRYLRFGLSPRGAQALVLAAKGHALLMGRYNVAFEDLRAMLGPALRHRFQLNFEGEADGIDAQALLTSLFDAEVKRAA
jgi:MoxR-like ATPase